MLVLSRDRDQVIRIGEEITVCVMEIRGSHVRLGIIAPDDVRIDREEVYLERKAQGRDKCLRASA